MKKLLKLLLFSFIICTLTACGKSEHEHQALLDMIENNSYEEAVKYINDLAYDYAKQNEQHIQKDNISEQLLGEWTYVESMHSEFSDFKTMEFKDNYTVLCDGKEYLWKVTNEYVDSNDLTNIEVKVLDGASDYLIFTYTEDDNSINLGQYKDDSYQWNNVNFFHISDYEKIEITIDNFKDYFEIYEYATWEKNSFDEIYRINITRSFKLKDEYYSRIPRIFNNVAFEYKYVTSDRKIEVDWINQTYNFGDIIEINDHEYTSTIKAGFRSNNNVDSYGFGFNSMYYQTDSSIDYVTNYIGEDDIEFIRIKGEIYLKK